MSNVNLLEDLEEQFKVRDFKYRVNGELITPNKDDLSKILAELRRLLENEPDGTQVSLGRLIMKKQSDHNDVFLFLGEYND